MEREPAKPSSDVFAYDGSVTRLITYTEPEASATFCSSLSHDRQPVLSFSRRHQFCRDLPNVALWTQFEVAANDRPYLSKARAKGETVAKI